MTMMTMSEKMKEEASGLCGDLKDERQQCPCATWRHHKLVCVACGKQFALKEQALAHMLNEHSLAINNVHKLSNLQE